ncbi:MAG: D-aminoacyl-tRNA deacylase [Bdellovibrionota bacterium]
MKVLLQRVSSASVTVDEKIRGAIGRGLVLLVGIAEGDTREKLEPMAAKLSNLRIFPDERGKFHYSLKDIGGEVLAVPQFTLFADTTKGRRPEFFGAMRPELAKPLFEEFAEALAAQGISRIECGVFGAHMAVELVNDGPVTIMLEA